MAARRVNNPQNERGLHFSSKPAKSCTARGLQINPLLPTSQCLRKLKTKEGMFSTQWFAGKMQWRLKNESFHALRLLKCTKVTKPSQTPQERVERYKNHTPAGIQRVLSSTLQINQVKPSLNNPACEFFKTDGVSMVPYSPFSCAQKQSPAPKLAPTSVLLRRESTGSCNRLWPSRRDWP